MVFGIEAGAPRDGGAMVTFAACPFTADYPEQREGQPPMSKIKIDNVNRELVPKIRAALGVRQYIQVLYREYRCLHTTSMNIAAIATSQITESAT